MKLVDVVIYSRPGIWLFDPAEHPLVTHMRAIASGGHGGAASDGTPGEPGSVESTGLVPVQIATVEIGYGGRGSGGGQDGEHGLVLVELYVPNDDDDR